jgi:hypothetical protein
LGIYLVNRTQLDPLVQSAQTRALNVGHSIRGTSSRRPTTIALRVALAGFEAGVAEGALLAPSLC